MDLNGKNVLITGGTSGMGLASAQSFAKEGCNVGVTGSDETRLRQALKVIQSERKVFGRVCDVSNREAVKQLFKQFEDEIGAVDILVNSAGINIGNRMMANIDPEEFDRVLAVNATGTFNCIYQALPGMRAKGEGLIVNIVSLAGKRVMELAGLPYCVSKFAQSAIGLFVNQEERENGIRVTNIYPGETNTPIVDKRPTPPPPERRARMLQSEDVAACVLFVAKLPANAVVPELIVTPPHMPLS